MKLALCDIFQVGLCAFGYLYATSEITLAQVTPDNSVNTTVNQQGNIAEITGGTTRQDNLFHSFREFSVGSGNEAFFNNAADISNIFSRVTGGQISNIDGLIRANGSANLFLINPAGIIFGQGARLNIGGSFYGSSANSILFPDGIEFNATDTSAQPILSINAPIGLNFRDNPGEIVNQSVANDLGLQVSSGETLSLIGGDVKLEGGLISAPGGLVELGGLLAAGEIAIGETGSLSFPEGIARSRVELTNDAAVDVRADGGGFININAKDLLLADTSELLAGIGENMGSVDTQAGDITINATDSVTLIGDEVEEDPNAGIEELDTSIRNLVGLPINRREDASEESSAVGNGGSIFVNTNLLQISNRASISAKVYGLGNAGDVNVTAQDISVDAGAILSQIRSGGEGNSGNINLDVDSLSVKDVSFIITDNNGAGNAGDININATDSVFVGGEIFNALISELGEDVVGEAGDINIDTKFLTIDGTQGGAQLLTISKGKGNAGNVNINARETISLLGGGGAILSQVGEGAEGNGGNINITSKSLDIQGDFTPDDINSGRFLIQASSQGVGDGGDIIINASEKILLNNASIFSQVLEQSTGNAGTITFDSPIISFDGTEGGAQLLTTSEGKGNAGNVNLNARETISLLGTGSILSQVAADAEGNGGDINITTKSLDIQGDFTPDDINSGRFLIQASSRGIGNSGNITINAAERISLNNASILSQVLEQSTGNTGTITLNSPIISFNDYSLVSNSILGQGLGGDISIDTDSLSIENFSILSSSARNDAVGNGGKIDIQSNEIRIAEGGVINSFTENDSNGGTIAITSNNLAILSGGKIVTQTDGGGNAGNITLNITEEITIDGSNPASSGELQPFEDNLLIELEPATGLFANTSNNSTGNSGNITIDTPNSDTPNSLNLVDGAQISVDSRGLGNGGTLTIQTDALNLDNGFISAATVSGIGGLLKINVNGNIRLMNSSEISARAFNDANGGNINIDTKFIVASPDSNSDIIANAEEGQGGNIDINAQSILGINEQPLNDLTNDINASSEFGLDGTVSITISEVDAIQAATELPSNIVAPEQTTTQACQANIEPIAASNLIINGRQVRSKPDYVLNSDNIFIDGENTNENTNKAADNLPRVINTSQGHITLARGVAKTPDGKIVLSPYPTDNQAERLPSNSANCS